MEEKIKMSKRTKNLVGEKFGRWVVLEFAGYKNKKAHWLCKCDCGKEKIVCGKNLILGKTKSCGCLHNEQIVEYFTKHGDRSLKNTTRLYTIWKNMRSRCCNSNNPKFNRYGGRGIKICDEWYNSYSCFRDWALSNGYLENLTIDRINNDGNYEPSNCRWATTKEQSRNRSTNVFLEHNGQIFVQKDFAKIIGIDRHTLSKKINEGMSVEEIIKYAQKKQKNIMRVMNNDQTTTL